MDSRVSNLFRNVIISNPPCRKMSDCVSLKTDKIYIVVKNKTECVNVR